LFAIVFTLPATTIDGPFGLGGQNDDDAMGNLRAADDSHLAMQCVCRGGTLKWVSSSNFPTATSEQQRQHRSSNCNIMAATSWLFRPPTPFIID